MGIQSHIRSLASAGIFAAAVLTGLGAAGAAGPNIVTYKDDVLPIIQVRCLKCHESPNGEGYKASGLDLGTYEGIMRGTQHGPIITPGNAFMSNLMVLIEGRAAPNLRMPHNEKPLSRCEIDVFRRWINAGAKPY